MTKRMTVLMLVLALFAFACGDSSSNSNRAGDSGDSDLFGESGDAGDSGDSAATGEAEEPFLGGDDYDTGDDSDSRDSAADAPAKEAAYDSDAEGLFAPEPDPDRSSAADREEDNTFENYGVRPFVEASVDPFSTFALDVDTGSYTVARRWLDEGLLPEPDSVRVEEFVNAFDYDYDAPREGLDIYVDGAPSPFEDGDVLVRIGVQAAVIDDRDRPNAALTFVVDTSGSMDRDNRLGLVKEALEQLVQELDNDDTVAIVTYSNKSSVVLEPTSVRDDDEIYDAIDDLRADGSTNLEAGLRTGYDLAEEAFIDGGINRVILASDGVANVGLVDPDELSRTITDRADDGIQLVTVGVGMGNFNDVTTEQLADQGDGFYAYVDSFDEAERLFEQELIATLTPVAIDARIQVEWDDRYVDAYRLIGFENRGVLDSEFRNDDVDAGELSSGHTVTAIYELDLDGDADGRIELGEIALRWKDPNDGEWIELHEDVDLRDVEDDWDDTSDEMKLATLVAAWAEILQLLDLIARSRRAVMTRS